MAYTISNTDGTTLLVLADGTIDQAATSLTLIGKNYSGFGSALNNNFVKLLANSASTAGSPPRSPLTGQLWYDTTNKRIMVYDDSFKSVSGATVSTDKPTLGVGDFWYDTVNGQLNIRAGSSTATTVIGPLFPKTVGANGWTLPNARVKDTGDNTRDVTLLSNYGTTLGYVASTKFDINTSTSYLITGTTTATVKGLTILADIQLAGSLYLGNNPPLDNNSTGTVGQFAYGSSGANENYLYVCTVTNAWSRIRLTDAGPW